MTLEQAQAVAAQVATARKKATCVITNVEILTDLAAMMRMTTDVRDIRTIGGWFKGSGALMTAAIYNIADDTWSIRFILVPATREVVHGA